MAQKIPKPKAKASPAPPRAGDAQKAGQELDILHPERSIRLRGRLLELREYGYIEGLSLQAGIGMFLDALYGLFGKAEGGPPSAQAVRQVFIRHAVTAQWLIAQSFTPYPDDSRQLEAFAEEVAANAAWVAKLNDIEGDMLLSAWWETNRGFFIRRLRERRLAEQEAESRSDSGGSTPP